jgi:hypothetical protein
MIAFRGLGTGFMAESDIPDRIMPAIRWVLAGIALFCFFLLALEKANEGLWSAAAINAGCFVATLIVAVYWHGIVGFLGRRRLAALYIGLLVICCVGAGFAIANLLNRAKSDQTRVSEETGRISWNLEQTAQGQAYFLNLNRYGDQETRFIGFGWRGKNTSKDPVSLFSGYVRSDITNERLPFFLMAQDPNAPAGPFAQMVPTRPDETFGIPGLADFDIVTYEKAVIESGKDGIPVSKLLKDFSTFTVVLEYDGTKIERQFTTEQIKKQLDLFASQTGQQQQIIPRVTRKPNATAPIGLPLFIQGPPKQPQLPPASEKNQNGK